VAVHNTPFGDIVDTEDDLQPLVFSMFKDARRATALVGAAMREASFETGRMATRASLGWITITELADTVARDHGLPFRTGHAIATRLMRIRAAEPTLALGEALGRGSQDVLGRRLEYSDSQVEKILSPQHFIEVRQTPGGPGSAVVGPAIDASRRKLGQDEEWLREQTAALRRAEEALQVRARAL
jgi:argininosuccinate lyase